MGFTELLRQRCDIKTDQAQPGSGYEAAPDWQVVAAQVPCLLQHKSGKQALVGSQAVLAEDTLFLPAGTALSEASRVAVEGVEYDVVLVRAVRNATEVHHIEADLRQVR